ncbi:MAG: Nex18 symbiotically induced protein [Rhodospirillaceae bacterium]|nr:Nex18 symbiotically induced protein [Rhodospirillaceae bacterium]
MKSFRKLTIAIVAFITFAGVASATATKKDIVDTAVAAGSFNTLVTAVKAAGLVDVLKSKGPFTVFAPTDAAFAKLPKGTLASLLKPENKAKLKAILTYHVLSGKVMAGDIKGKALTAKTVQGSTVAVDGKYGVKVNDAKVTAADIAATNGVIHVIDTVILPPSK